MIVSFLAAELDTREALARAGETAQRNQASGRKVPWGPPPGPLRPPRGPPAGRCVLCSSGPTDDPGLYCVAAKNIRPKGERRRECRKCGIDIPVTISLIFSDYLIC